MSKLGSYGIASVIGLLAGLVLIYWLEDLTSSGAGATLALSILIANAIAAVIRKITGTGTTASILVLVCVGTLFTGCKMGAPSSAPIDVSGTVPKPAAAPAPMPSPAPRLMPTRAFAETSQIPPVNVGAYGMVAFTQMPSDDATRERALRICKAYLSTLPARDVAARTVPVSQQMVTLWPVYQITSGIREGDCNSVLGLTDQISGYRAKQDAERQGETLSGRGPFLIAWSPAATRGQPDAVVLVFNLSTLESQDAFNDIFLAWSDKIVANPDLWRSGFAIERIRISLTEFLNKYGETIMTALKG